MLRCSKRKESVNATMPPVTATSAGHEPFTSTTNDTSSPITSMSTVIRRLVGEAQPDPHVPHAPDRHHTKDRECLSRFVGTLRCDTLSARMVGIPCAGYCEYYYMCEKSESPRLILRVCPFMFWFDHADELCRLFGERRCLA